MNYAVIKKSSYAVVMGYLLVVGQSAQAYVELTPVARQPVLVQGQAKAQESRISTFKKRVLSSTGALVALGVCCCALTYWCLQLQKNNVDLATQVTRADENLASLTERVHNQGETIIALGNSVSNIQDFVSGRLDLMEKAVFKNNEVKGVGTTAVTDKDHLGEWSKWMDSTSAGTNLSAVQVPVTPKSNPEECSVM